MSTALSNAQCPYCDHVSPAGSKFCNDCGAALHLRPCPHCGSVNDITQNTHCSRCNGDLGLVEAADRPEDEPGGAIERSAPTAEPEFAATPDRAPFESPKRSGYRMPLFALLVIAVLVASYFGLRSTPEPAPGKAALAPAPVQTAVKPAPTASDELAAADKAPAPAPALAAEAAASASAPAQDPPPMPAPAFAASLAKLSPPSAGPAPAAKRSASLPPAAPPPAQPYSEGPGLRSPGEGLNLKSPSIGKCTDAVAALGLCTPESSPRSP